MTSYEFNAAQLPLAALSQGSLSVERVNAIEALYKLAEQASLGATITAYNICVTFIRAIVMVSTVSPRLGLVLNSIAMGSQNFIFFIFIFFIMFTGFAICGHFMFGASSIGFSSIGEAQEARNTPFFPSQANFHTVGLRGVRNISEAP